MADEQKKIFGKHVRKVRDALNLKQKEFSQGLGISVQHLSDIERGKKKTCLDFFFKMVKVYNVNLNYLLLGDGEMFLQEIGNNQSLLKGFAANNPDAKEFLYYFVNSSMVHYHVLSDFRKFFNTEEKAIKDDIKKKSSVVQDMK
jgi:transcriptional regulator with XRE-family HTH domain